MQDRLGKFEIVRLLGRGSMGVVYLGRDPKLGREVALKVISAGSAFGAEAQARFEREARAAAMLNHPHIVTVFEFGDDEGLHYLAMEYVEGEDLDVLIRSGTTPKAELLEALAQVCDGLAYAHQRGVIHRDIKPANVLVTRHGRKVHAKLMDFGVAQMGPSGLTQTGTWMGTVSYMAPEYLDSGKSSTSSDIFALGVMLYEILTGGRKPFSGDTTTAVLNRILLHPPEPIRMVELKDISGQLLAVAERALAKRPEDRFADAEELGQAIRDAAAGTREGVPVSVGTILAPPLVAARLDADSAGQQIRVGKGGQGQCLSLKVALRQARAGAEITLLPGLYREAVVLDKDVIITGLGEIGEVVLEGLKAPTLISGGQDLVLRNLTLRVAEEGAVLRITGGTPRLESCVLVGGVEVASGASPRFQDCQLLTGGVEALVVAGGAQVNLVGGSLRGFRECGLRLEAGAQATLQGVEFGPGDGVGLKVGARAQATADTCGFLSLAGSVEIEPEGRVHLTRSRLMSSHFAGLLALERSHAVLDACVLGNHTCSGAHVLAGANVMLRQCRLEGNPGFGISVMDRGLATLDGCTVQGNGGAGLLINHGATVQARSCTFSEGLAMGVDCAEGGQGVLDGCELSGNAGAGAQVEPGGSLLLVRCTLKDGRDTGLLLLEDSQATLEECVMHRNARGGVLLARDAADPVVRGQRIEDDIHRVDAMGQLVKVTPV